MDDANRYEIEDWYNEAINLMPDEVALKCFSAALRRHEQNLDDEQKISILKKRWCDIKVQVIVAENEDEIIDELHQIVSGRNSGVGKPRFRNKNQWLTTGNNHYYVNRQKLDRGYDECECDDKEIFVFGRHIMSSAQWHCRLHPMDDEKKMNHLYTSLLALEVVRCKFLAMIDFDMQIDDCWMRWTDCFNNSLSLYDMIKTESLAAGWAMYIMSKSLPSTDVPTLFEIMGKERTAWNVGYSYLMTPNALQDAIAKWENTLRYFDFNKPVNKLFGGDLTKINDHWHTPMNKWLGIVYYCQGKVMERMDELQALDSEVEKGIEYFSSRT